MTSIVSTPCINYLKCRDCGKRFSEFYMKGDCTAWSFKQTSCCPKCGSENVEPLTMVISRKIIEQIFHK